MLFGEGPQIKNIAVDLNKLFRQGSLLNQSSQTVEGDAAADQGAVDLLAARDPVIQEISVGMSGEQSARYTVSGTPPLSLPNSLGKPLKAWSVEVLPYQEGTGDPSPMNIRPIHGTNRINLFVEESYDQSATPKAVITLPQTVYTGTIGSDGGESRSGYKVFDGSSDEVIRIYSGTRFTITIPDYTAPATSVVDSISASYLKTVNKGSQGSTLWLISGSDNGTHDIMINFGLSTVTEMREYLADHPLEVVYPLTTSTEFTVTAPSILTSTGTATTWATAEDGTVDGMSVTYVGKA